MLRDVRLVFGLDSGPFSGGAETLHADVEG